MFGLTLSRTKRASTFNCMSTALDIASTVEFMLTRPELRVKERLQSGEYVIVGVLGPEIYPSNGANLTFEEIDQMEIALNRSFSSQLFPARFFIEKIADGTLRATITPGRS